MKKPHQFLDEASIEMYKVPFSGLHPDFMEEICIMAMQNQNQYIFEILKDNSMKQSKVIDELYNDKDQS